MNIGIIGYGSMGKMLAEKFASSGVTANGQLYVSNRTKDKLTSLPDGIQVCESNAALASCSDIVFVCVRPVDLKDVLGEIQESLDADTLLVSLNGSITFEMMQTIIPSKIAKVIPSVTAEINRSQTLVCFNDAVSDDERYRLKQILTCFGSVIELPENEIGMGSELVSCMPGFIASIFDVLCQSALDHTAIPRNQVIRMVLNTLNATSELMIRNNMSFDDVVARVATKGGITEEGTKVVYDLFPDTAGLMFTKTLDKRRKTAENARKLFTDVQST